MNGGSSRTRLAACDEVTNRDFWYYVAFVTDGCGNVSAVSNRTNGTLNYHLGDVTNGFVAGTGNNLVDTILSTVARIEIGCLRIVALS